MKKFNKYFSLAVISFVGASWATSCDSSKDIDAFTEYSGAPGVYFSETADANLKLTDEATTVSYPVYRENDSAAETVNITVTPLEDYDTDYYTFPSSVTFAAGEKVAQFEISYNFSEVEFDVPEYYQLTLEGVTVSPFGLGTVEISIVNPAPWNNIGTGYFVDAFWVDFEGETPIYQNQLDETKYRIPNYWNDETPWFEFQILKNGEDFYCEFLGNTYAIPTEGDNLVGFQSIYVFTDAGDEGDLDFYYVMPWFFDFSDSHCYVAGYKEDGTPGEIRLSPIVYEPNYGYWYGDTSKEEMISITFPGYVASDTSLEVEYDGILMNGNNYSVQGYVNVGADLTTVKVGVGSGSDAESIAAGIDDGSIASQEVTVSGNVKISFDQTNPSGKYTLVAVGYVGDEVKNTASATFTYTGTSTEDPNKGWKDLGYVAYTDGYVCANWFIFEGEILSYYVPIQESTETPGLYRLVDPYGQYFPWNEPGDWDESVTSYLYVNASNPDCVYIPECPQTLQWDASQGYLSCYSIAANYLEQGASEDDVIAEGVNGTLANGQITFPALTLAINWSKDANWYSANYALDYAEYAAGNTKDPYFYDADGELVAPFCIDFNMMEPLNKSAKKPAVKVNNKVQAPARTLKAAPSKDEVKANVKASKKAHKKMKAPAFMK